MPEYEDFHITMAYQPFDIWKIIVELISEVYTYINLPNAKQSLENVDNVFTV